jgi:hypothetical protein
MDMEISSADFMKLTINQVSDLLLQDISENNKKESGAVLHGTDDDGRMYSLKVELFRDE